MKYFLTFLILVTATNAQSSIKNTDIPSLESGKQILYKEVISDAPWPKIHIYQLIDATPLEVLAIFLALDHQKNYLPNLKSSTPIKHVGPTEVHTSYELELPWPLSNSHYTHASDFKKVSTDEYSAKWWAITSESAEEVKGSAIFKKYKGQTLMEYHSFVRPKSFLAGLVKSSMVKDTLASIEAVRTELKRAKKNEPQLIEKYKKIITDSLNGVNAYDKIINKLSSKK